jgi:opacity protein-like surface antigen
MVLATRLTDHLWKLCAAAVCAGCVIGLSSLSYAGAPDSASLLPDAPGTGSNVSGGTSTAGFRVWDSVDSVPYESPLSFSIAREIPSISRNVSVQGRTLTPYIGAGFNRGYTSDLEHSLSRGLSSLTESPLGSLLGQSLIPNEFQWGLRIPF